MNQAILIHEKWVEEIGTSKASCPKSNSIGTYVDTSERFSNSTDFIFCWVDSIVKALCTTLLHILVQLL